MSRAAENSLPRLGLARADPLPMSDDTWESLARSLGLTDRELQVVQSLFRGDAETAIASELGISPHTVHSHFDRIHRKLGVTSRVALVVQVFSAYLRLQQETSREEPRRPTNTSGWPTSLELGDANPPSIRVPHG